MAEEKRIFKNWVIPFAASLIVVILLDVLVSSIFNVSLFKGVYQTNGVNLVKSLLLALVIVIALGFVGYGLTRGEDNWKFKKIKDKYSVILFNKARVTLNNAINRTVGPRVWWKRWVPHDKLMEILKENKIILFSLSNYLKRLYIMYAKMGQVVTAKRIAAQ